MRLKLTVDRPSSLDGESTGPANILVTADATSTAGDVARALAGSKEYGGSGVSGDLTLRVLDGHRSGTTLATEQSLFDSGLRSGSRVEIVPAQAEPAESQVVGATLRVVAGPDGGLEVPLLTGSSTIGRAGSCDVRLSDPMVSKQHARINVGSKIELIDTNSANGIIVGGVAVGRVSLGLGDTATLGDSTVTVTPTAAASGMASTSTDIAFVRPPRVLARPRAVQVPLPEIESEPDAQSFPWLAMAAPLIMGVVLYAATRSLLSIVFIGLSPILMAGSYFDQRIQVKRKLKRARARFHASLSQLDEEMVQRHSQDREQLKLIHPSLGECLQACEEFNSLLWCRRPEHPEFLQVRLGLGDIPAVAQLESPRSAKGLPDLVARAREAVDRFRVLDDAPVIADLRDVGGVGVCGQADLVDGAARALVAQLAILHSPAELVFACLTSPTSKARWQWLEWMPHSASPHSPLGSRHLAADSASGTTLLDRLEGLVAERTGDELTDATLRGPRTDEPRETRLSLPAVVVVVDDPVADRPRLTALAERGPDVGVHVLWVGERRHDLPALCRTYLDVGDGSHVSVGMVRDEHVVPQVFTASLDEQSAHRVARRLAPVVDGGAPVHDESDLPRSVSVVSILGPEASDDAEQVVARWRENRSLIDRSSEAVRALERPLSLRAWVGHAGTEPFGLDLRSQGPHALVGGTTGAGKSEFLQSWVLGMAHSLSPDRLTFLFVDYKGGAAFAKCVKLPHCVGLVTDLSAHLVQRALTSLKAELKHREHLINRKRAKDLIELERRGDPDCPPSLVIVVDEFAALKTEVPEFFDGIVDVAQRGRSLGLHLIMATQRPAGVITDSLKANTNLRIALRMADEADSVDVLGTPMAAHFDPAIPGRAAAKTGPGRVAAFQSGFPGAVTPDQPPAPPIGVDQFDFGRMEQWEVPAPPAAPTNVPADIDRVVGTLRKASNLAEVPAPRKPWLPSLARVYNMERLRQRTDEELLLGVVDVPEQQAQISEYFRPDDEGSLVFYGVGGSGKTTALRSLAVAASLTPRSGRVHVYGLDFAGGGLSMLEPLPNVAPIIPGTDVERVERMLGLLEGVIAERSASFRDHVVATLPDYRRAAARPQEPRLLLLIDGFGAFREAFEHVVGLEAVFARLQRILAEGRAMGVHVAVSADRPNAIPTAMAGSFQRRVVLRQADDDAYRSFGVPVGILRQDSPPGRCVQAHLHQELQIAILGDDVSAPAQAALIAELATDLDDFHADRPAEIRVLRDLIPAEEMPARVGALPVLGVDYGSLQPVGLEVAGPVVISGPSQSGRTNAVLWMAHAFRRARPQARLVHLSPRRTTLTSWSHWAQTASNPGEAESLALKLTSEITGGSIDDVVVCVEMIADFVGTEAEYPLLELLDACRRAGVVVVGENEATQWAYSDLLNAFKNSRTGLLLQPDRSDGDLLGAQLPRANRADFPAGRGYWVRAGRAHQVQVPWMGHG